MNNLVENDVIIKAWNRVYNLAQEYGMNLEEFERHCEVQYYKENLTNHEIQLIWAYKIKQTINRLESENKDLAAKEICQENSWIKRFDFKNIDKAVKHLEEVCEYIRREYNVEYGESWLLDYDIDLYNKYRTNNFKPIRR